MPSIASDTLAFQLTQGVASNVTVLFQGTTPFVNTRSGAGVRCVGGTLKRLYTKNASNGTVRAPSGAEPRVSTRSATLGDPIAPGSTRFYQVYYRDPAIAFCSTGDTFNVSSGYRIDW